MLAIIITLTQDAEAIVDGDDDDASVAGQDGAVVGVAGIPFVALAVYEHNDRVSGCGTLTLSRSCCDTKNGTFLGALGLGQWDGEFLPVPA